MTLQQLVTDPVLLQSYRDWLKHPITEKVREMAMTFATPVSLHPVTSESALYAHGHAVAAANLIRVMFDIERVVEEQREIAKMKIDPDYGMRKLLLDGKETHG